MFYLCSELENTVLGIFAYKMNTIGVRLKRDSSIIETKDIVCQKWSDLTPGNIEFSCVRDGKKMVLETDFELQSLACYCCVKYIASIVIEVSLGNGSKSVSYSVDRGVSASSSSNIYDEVQSAEPLCLASGSNIVTLIGVGQIFKGGAEDFRNTLLLYCITNGYRVVYVKNCPRRITVECYLKSQTNCTWRVHASLKYGLPGFFMIKKMQGVHSCGAGFTDVNHPAVSSKLVKALVLNHVRKNPMIKTKDIQDRFLVDYGVLLSYYFAYSGK